jgi:mannose-6-phosphate isomerase class I
LGKDVDARFGILSLLIKFIDARDNLSIQYIQLMIGAQRHHSFVKRKCWYVVKASPQAAFIPVFRAD